MKHAARVHFPGASGARLAGRLHLPPSPPRAFALFAHCFTCSKDLRAAVHLSHALATEGIATLRFDFTGLGESEGDFAGTHFSSNVDDLVAAADYLRREHAAPSLLVGHSLGGAAVLAAARLIPETRAVATVGAPAEPSHVRALVAPDTAELAARGEHEVTIAGRSFTITRRFLEDLGTHENEEAIRELGAALLVFHSPQDAIVGVDNARRIFEAARHPKSFVSLDGADHLLTDPEDARYVGSVLAAWAHRYLEPAVEAKGADVEKGGAVVVEGGPRGYAQRVIAGPHVIPADEPESLGGTDTGPTPYDYLLAALGACTNITLRMYANRKKWPLEGVVTTLRHTRIHARDCEDCEAAAGLVDDVEKRLVLKGQLEPAQRERLVEISKKCPVHKTMLGETRIRTILEG